MPRFEFTALPPADQLRSLLDYDAETGALRWRSHRANVTAGRVAGHITARGEAKIRIDGRLYLVHRIIWKMMTGNDPVGVIDHRNLQKSDNRWANLRLASPAQNNANSLVRSHSELGVKGVTRSDTKSERYQAVIRVKGKAISLGSFGTIEEASQAYQAAARKYYGEFAR